MAPELPGFYYDETKRKYFKIVPNHHGTPSSSRHTTSSVAQTRQTRMRHLDAVVLQAKIESSTVKRSKILQIADAGAPLLREYGLTRTSPASEGMREYALRSNSRIARHNIGGLREPYALVIDSDTDLAVVCDQEHMYIYQPKSPRYNCLRAVADGSPTTSISTNVQRACLWTSLTYCFFMHAPDDPNKPPLAAFRIRGLPSKVKADATYRAGALNPYRHLMVLAVNQYMTISNFCPYGLSESEFRFRSTFDTDEETSPDVLALDWHGPFNPVCTRRNGHVILYDVRSESSAIRLRFPSAATKVKSVGDSQILVAGLEKQMHLYDLRFTPGIDSKPQFRADVMRVERKRGLFARPVMSYPTYGVKARPDLGWDVDTKLGLIAAAEEDGSIGLIGLRDGKKIKHPLLDKYGPEGAVLALAFVQGDTGLAVGTLGGIETVGFGRQKHCYGIEYDYEYANRHEEEGEI